MRISNSYLLCGWPEHLLTVEGDTTSTFRLKPAGVPPRDEAYLLYMDDVVGKEMLHYETVAFLFEGEIRYGDPPQVQAWTNVAEPRTEELKSALERAPKPLHPALKKEHQYLLQAMQRQLDGVRCLYKACLSRDQRVTARAVDYQGEVLELLGCAAEARYEYMKGLQSEETGSGSSGARRTEA